MRTSPPSPATVSPVHVQRGAALVVALIFLVSLTLLGLAAMGGNTLQQRMTYSVGETNLAFQSAESGLVAGESWLESQTNQPVPDCTGTCGASTAIWAGRPPAGTPREVSLSNLRSSTWWNNQGRKFGFAYTETASPALVAGQQYALSGEPVDVDSLRYPRYVVEELGKDPTGSLVIGGPRVYTLWYYQISARGTGAQPQPATVVQSVYTKGF